MSPALYEAMRRRWPYQAAHPYFRCCARASNLDHGETAQCMRRYNDDFRRNRSVDRQICTQHGNMLLAGKTVIEFRSGEPMKLRRHVDCTESGTREGETK